MTAGQRSRRCARLQSCPDVVRPYSVGHGMRAGALAALSSVVRLEPGGCRQTEGLHASTLLLASLLRHHLSRSTGDSGTPSPRGASTRKPNAEYRWLRLGNFIMTPPLSVVPSERRRTVHLCYHSEPKLKWMPRRGGRLPTLAITVHLNNNSQRKSSGDSQSVTKALAYATG